MNYFQQASERLEFRALTLADIDSWAAFFINNDSLDYLGIPDLSKSERELAEEWIQIQLKRYETSGFGHLAIIEKESSELIGTSGILPRDLSGEKEFEIAYSLKPVFWGKGYGTEAAQQMKQFGITHQISTRFISIIHKANIASMRVAKKNGMNPLYEMEYLGMEVIVYGTER